MSKILDWINDSPIGVVFWVFAIMAFPFGAVFRVVLLSTKDRATYDKVEVVGCIVAAAFIVPFFVILLLDFFGFVPSSVENYLSLLVALLAFPIGAMMGADFVKFVYKRLVLTKEKSAQPPAS